MERDETRRDWFRRHLGRRVTSAEHMRGVGREIAHQLDWGDVLFLEGDLGAGKTELTKGIAEGLGSRDVVQSPTYTLVHEYRGGRIPMFHLDFYRLEDAHEIIGAGLETYFEPEGVSVIEWACRWESPIPVRPISIRLHIVSETERDIEYRDKCEEIR